MFMNILMTTSLHLPRRLRELVDQRARRLGISRNRLIVTILEKELTRETRWSPGFLERLVDISADDAAAANEMMGARAS
jgi:hypothetical protein